MSAEPFFSGQNVATETQPMLTESNVTNPLPNQTQSSTQAESEINSSVNNNEQTVRDTIESSTSQAAELHPEETNDSQDTNESKAQEVASNADNADNNDVINVYSSGDEGIIVCFYSYPSNFEKTKRFK